MVGCGEHGGGDGPLYTLDLLWDYNALNGFVVLLLRKLKDSNNVESLLNSQMPLIFECLSFCQRYRRKTILLLFYSTVEDGFVIFGL